MAETAVERRGVSIALACRAFGVSETCYRYSAKLKAENEVIADRECPTFCVSVIWSMLPERSKDDDDFERTAGRVAEGLQAA
jgi:hypothetical protein